MNMIKIWHLTELSTIIQKLFPSSEAVSIFADVALWNENGKHQSGKIRGDTADEAVLMLSRQSILMPYCLFRVGDFYETFGEDAIHASEILGITLTRRANGAASYVELAGFPYHALDTYLPKLVRAGQRVAICEQLEDPKLTKKIVKRGITELVTPGVSFNDNVLSHKENNFLGSSSY
ncbi:MAG: hypothetical protein MZV63_57025 [Marinilabiliales bacterium]|nr:hypothetical protein [Marinilabiliales bacterium]